MTSPIVTFSSYRMCSPRLCRHSRKFGVMEIAISRSSGDCSIICNACDKLCNFAGSGCVADMFATDAAGAGAGLCKTKFVASCDGLALPVRDKIDGEAVEENVARAQDIFNSVFDLDL